MRRFPALYRLVSAALAAWTLICLAPAAAVADEPAQQLLLLSGGCPGHSSVYLDFAHGYYCGAALAQIKNTRASAEECVDSLGTWHAVTAGQNCITNLGIWSWEGRINSEPNSSAVGAVAGTIGAGAFLPNFWNGNLATNGLGGIQAAVATVNGLSVLSQNISGTLSATISNVLAFDTIGSIAASPGQVWAGSIFTRLLSGSLTTGITSFDLTVREYDNTNTFLRQTLFSVQGTGAALGRIPGFVLTGASTASIQLGLRLVANSGSTLAFNLQFGAGQLELVSSATTAAQAFVTPPIPTTNGALARAADRIVISNSYLFANAFSSYFQGTTYSPINSISDQTAMQWDDGTPNNIVIVGRLGATAFPKAQIIVGGVNSIYAPSIVWATATTGKLALLLTNSTLQGRFNGGNAASIGSTGLPPATTIRIGTSASGSAPWNGVIPLVAISPTSLLNR